MRVNCTKDKVDLGETSYGEKTVIRRIDKSIIISYNKNTGPGMKATEEEQQSVIKSLEETGYTCG